MQTFVRFIFLLLIAGAALNVGIVIIQDAKTHQAQSRNTVTERERFRKLLKLINGQLRRGEVAVEWQRIDASEKVLESALLIRQFVPTEDERPVPLPTVRVIIPGDRLSIDGLRLRFDSLYSEEYKELRGADLFYFRHVYGEGESIAKRFTFMTPYRVPQATEIHILDRDPRPSYFEGRMWDGLWNLIQEPDLAAKRGLTVTPIPPTTVVVKGGRLYQITVGLEGVVIEEDTQGHMRDRQDMLDEGSHLRGPAAPGSGAGMASPEAR